MIQGKRNGLQAGSVDSHQSCPLLSLSGGETWGRVCRCGCAYYIIECICWREFVVLICDSGSKPDPDPGPGLLALAPGPGPIGISLAWVKPCTARSPAFGNNFRLQKNPSFIPPTLLSKPLLSTSDRIYPHARLFSPVYSFGSHRSFRGFCTVLPNPHAFISERREALRPSSLHHRFDRVSVLPVLRLAVEVVLCFPTSHRLCREIERESDFYDPIISPNTLKATRIQHGRSTKHERPQPQRRPWRAASIIYSTSHARSTQRPCSRRTTGERRPAHERWYQWQCLERSTRRCVSATTM